MPVLDWIGKKQASNYDNKVPFRIFKRNESLSVGREYKGEIGNILSRLTDKYKFMTAAKSDIEAKNQQHESSPNQT